MVESELDEPLETERGWAEKLIFGCRRLLLLGRGLKKLLLNRSGGFWLPDGAGDVGFRRGFGFEFGTRASRVSLSPTCSTWCPTAYSETYFLPFSF